jgi:hypothetical protein
VKLSAKNIVLKAWKPAHSRAKRLTETITGIRWRLLRIVLSQPGRLSLAATRFQRIRRVKVSVETERILVVVQQAGMERWCFQCDANVKVVGLEEAALIAGKNRQTILNEVSALHVADSPPGDIWICTNSLLSYTSPRTRIMLSDSASEPNP